MRHQILHIHIYSIATRSGEPHNALHSSSYVLLCMWYRARMHACVHSTTCMCANQLVCSLPEEVLQVLSANSGAIIITVEQDFYC